MKPDRARASRLWEQGIDQEAAFAFDSAIALYRSATRADPTFLPGYLDQLRLQRYLGTSEPLSAELARRTDITTAHRRCLLDVVRIADDGSPSWIDQFRAMRAEQGSTPCVLYGLAKALQVHPTRRQAPLPEELDAARTVAQAFPDHAESVILLVQALTRLDRHAAARDVAHRFVEASPHAMSRVYVSNYVVRAIALLGDTTGAIATYERTLDAGRRDGRAWLLHVCLGNAVALAGMVPRARSDAWTAEQARILLASPYRAMHAAAAISIAGPMVEAGRMLEALEILTPHLGYVERNGLSLIETRLRHLQGRALVRSGRPRDAIPVLEKARAAATRGHSVQYVAEAEHQLTHAYEGLKDWPRAARESERFIAAAQETADDAIRVVSYYDAASIRWKAGWHGAADSLSRLMVAAIERERTHYAFGAEYFERIGDLGAAMTYLRRGAVRSPLGDLPDANFLYAGLTRLHLALGNTDSALVAATKHDSLPWTFDELLVPKVLIARGEPARAVAEMRRWITFQAERGNVRAEVKALVSLAEMLVAASPAEAVAAAREAETVARANAFTLETLMAVRARGQAATRLRAADAPVLLERARAMAREHPDAMQTILTDVSLGEAYLSVGRPAAALGAYRDAVRRIEETGRSVTDDVVLAQFRAARTGAFNGALRTTLVSTPDARTRIDSVLAWSARKKAPAGARAGIRAVGARAIQRTLRPTEALVDYLVVDSAVVATVVTAERATLHELPISSGEALALARRLTRPFTTVIGGRVDLARAPFDVATSRRLYDALVAPLAPALAGITELTIVPDAPLHAVPFDALVVATGRDTTFVIDRFATRYALAPLPRAASRAVARTDRVLLVVGDAPGAAQERDQLRAAWGAGIDVLDGERGTETGLAHGAGRGGVLHVASHARSNDRDPLASYLTLARDSVNDGMLHYAEIARMPNRYALVMLNACETSAGPLLAGSGFMSLARAFLVGGSQAVIATQWPVGATSATVGARFYERVRLGASASGALHDAKLALRRSPATAHPFYWASHVLLQPN